MATPQAEAWSLISRAFIEDKGRRVKVLNDFGMTWAQGWALREIDPENPVSMSAVAQSMQCDNSQVTAIADRLEALGLVERQVSEADRRVKVLALTAKGVEVRHAVHAAMNVPPPAIAAISDADAEVVRDILRKAIG